MKRENWIRSRENKDLTKNLCDISRCKWGQRMDLFVVKIISTSCKTILFFYYWQFHSMSKNNFKKSVAHFLFYLFFDDGFFSEVFFNHWNVSLGLEKNFILYMWWLVDGSMVFVLYENWNECFQKSKNLSPRTILKGITSVARTFLKQHDEKIVLTFY